MKKVTIALAMALVTICAVGIGVIFGIWLSALKPNEVTEAQAAHTERPLAAQQSDNASSPLPETNTATLQIEQDMLSRYQNPYDGLPPQTYTEDTVVVPILMYHHIEAPPTDEGVNEIIRDLYVSPDMFSRQMEYLYLSDYQTISLSELLSALLGETILPEKSVILTFDDLYQSQVDVALPVLEQYGFDAIFFVNVYSSGVYNARIQAVIDAGQEIGCHGVAHLDVRGMSATELAAEILGCKTTIEAQFSLDSRHYAYAGCNYDDAAAAAVASYGYETAVTCVTPWNGNGLGDRHHLSRRIISEDYDKFLARLEDRSGVW